MSEFTIYHNPRCSKSRTTLALLEDNGVSPQVVLYLETQPDEAEIRSLMAKLGVAAGGMIRRGEDAFNESGLGPGSTEDDLVGAMARHSKLIERPIVVRGDRAVIGRPPENVLELIK